MQAEFYRAYSDRARDRPSLHRSQNPSATATNTVVLANPLAPLVSHNISLSHII